MSGVDPTVRTATYLARTGAWGTLDARRLVLLDRPVDPATALESIRRGAGDLLTRVLPEPEAGLAAGILIGLRDRVDREVAASFTTAGVSHVVAISGWNIAIVAAAIATVAGGSGVGDEPWSPLSRSSPTSSSPVRRPRCCGPGRWRRWCSSRANPAGQGERRPRSAGPRRCSSSPIRGSSAMRASSSRAWRRPG